MYIPLAYSSLYNGKQSQALSMKVEKRAFYRAEVYDLTHDCRVAIGNPIWLDQVSIYNCLLRK